MGNRYIKTAIIGRLLIIALIGFYVSLFILRQWFESMVRLLAVFFVLPYTIIYFQRVWKYGMIALFLISVGLGYYIGRNTYLILGFAAALIGFYQTSNAIHEDIHNKIKVSDFGVFTGESVEKFVTYFTLAYVFCFIAFNQTFTLTCHDLYRYGDKIMQTVLFRDSELKDSVEGFFKAIPVPSAIAPLIGTGTSTTIKDGNLTNKPIPSSDPGAKYRVDEEQKNVGSIIDAISVHESAEVSSEASSSVSVLVQKGTTFRESLLNQTVDQSQALEEGMCGVLLDQITDRYSDPDFKLSVVFSMYLIIRPAMEIVLHILSYLNWLIFRVMFSFKWFRKYEDWEVSENLE